MNGNEIKKAAISKAKQVATAANNAANGNGGKKRRKGQDLKPIITVEDQQPGEGSAETPTDVHHSRWVILDDPRTRGAARTWLTVRCE